LVIFCCPRDAAGDHDWRHTADLLADEFPGPSFLALDIEKFFREIGTRHG